VSTYDEYKGEIHWPVTGAGLQRLVRCPYSYDDPSYASYDCLLLSDDNYTAKWMNLNIETCPDPPFSRVVDLLYNSIVSIKRFHFFIYICIFSARLLLKTVLSVTPVSDAFEIEDIEIHSAPMIERCFYLDATFMIALSLRGLPLPFMGAHRIFFQGGHFFFRKKVDDLF